jgi:ABC-type dipeptide/oligopeptide/nickel transport system permease subunit
MLLVFAVILVTFLVDSPMPLVDPRLGRSDDRCAASCCRARLGAASPGVTAGRVSRRSSLRLDALRRRRPRRPNRLQPPSAAHWFGTDHFGRDIFSMIMVGARTSIAVALVAVGIGMGLGVPLGLAGRRAAAAGSTRSIMRGNDLVFAFPALLIAIMITAVFGPGRSTPSSPSASSTSRSSRGCPRRGAVLWTREFVLAARVAGKGAARISIEHILPNIAEHC